MSDPFEDRTPGPPVSTPADTWPLTAREAAAILGVHERTIRRAIGRGEIVASKHGGAFRIASAELDHYRALHRFRGRSAPSARLIAFPGGVRRLPGTVPRPLTSLIGRDPDIADIVRQIEREDVRLLTLTGPGGVGKTRIAIAVAEAADAFPDGVLFVSLASTRDQRLVGGAIAQALGVHSRLGRSLVERASPVLLGRGVLLVLDNFEHVIDAAPIVTDLLGAFPGVTVLATSRVRLRLMGEHVVEVPTLALTPEGNGAGAGALPVAARLFVERARELRREFTPTPEDQRVIEAICRRLDGLPLAIELAAARTAVLPLRDLLDWLEPRLPVLVDGARDLPERQRTMRDTIAWSYHLLDPLQQSLFRRLSVFVGGFTLAAAQHIAGGQDHTPGEALAGLSALVDASLLRLSERAPTSRYVMLETVREYGLEMLDQLGETRAARDAHASWFLGLDGWLDPNTIAPGVTVDDRLREIEPEQPNIEAALGHFADIGDAAAVVHLAGQCAIFWHHRAYLSEGRRWLEYGLAHTPARQTLDRGNALAGLSLILWTQVEPETAAPLAQEALVIGQRIGDTHLTALALHMLGVIATLGLRWQDAKTHMERALPLWQETGERSSVAMALMILAEIEYGLDALSRSRERAEAAIEVFRTIGHDSGVAFSMVRLGRIAYRQGNRAAAVETYRDALRLWTGIGERWASIKALVGLAEIAAQGDQPEVAAVLIGVVDQRAYETGGGVFPVDRDHYERAMATARAAIGEERFVALCAEGRTLSTADAVEWAMSVKVTRRRRSEPDGLSRREREVLRLLVEGHSNAEIADALFIAERTARTHVASILAKLGVSTRTAAASHAIRHNLI